MTRRKLLLLASQAPALAALHSGPSLDRRKLVSRHNPILQAADPRTPLSVGNGEFAFTADVTGLQSLRSLYEPHVPLCTQSQWGWHSFPIPNTYLPPVFPWRWTTHYAAPSEYAP